MRLDEVMGQVVEILKTGCENPGEELIRHGETLVKIGKAIQELPPADARKVIHAVAVLHGIRV